MGTDDELEPSAWEIAHSKAMAERLEKMGLSGAEWNEIPSKLQKEAEATTLEEVGQNPDNKE